MLSTPKARPIARIPHFYSAADILEGVSGDVIRLRPGERETVAQARRTAVRKAKSRHFGLSAISRRTGVSRRTMPAPNSMARHPLLKMAKQSSLETSLTTRRYNPALVEPPAFGS